MQTWWGLKKDNVSEVTNLHLKKQQELVIRTTAQEVGFLKSARWILHRFGQAWTSSKIEMLVCLQNTMYVFI